MPGGRSGATRRAPASRQEEVGSGRRPGRRLGGAEGRKPRERERADEASPPEGRPGAAARVKAAGAATMVKRPRRNRCRTGFRRDAAPHRFGRIGEGAPAAPRGRALRTRCRIADRPARLDGSGGKARSWDSRRILRPQGRRTPGGASSSPPAVFTLVHLIELINICRVGSPVPGFARSARRIARGGPGTAGAENRCRRAGRLAQCAALPEPIGAGLTLPAPIV